MRNIEIGKAWNGSTNPDRAICTIPITGGSAYIITFDSSIQVNIFEKASISDATTIYNTQITSGYKRVADKTANVLVIQFSKENITTNDIIEMNIQIEYGTESTAYIPNPSSCDYIARENLAVLSDDINNKITSISEKTGNLANLKTQLKMNKSWNLADSSDRAVIFIEIEGGKQYSIVFTAGIFNSISVIEKESIESTTDVYRTDGISSEYSHISNDNAKYLCIQFTKTNIVESDFNNFNISVVYGSKTNPYIAPVSACDNIVRNRMITYVTPEMFGAWGDGIHDDTAALQAAIDSGINVRAERNYMITDSLIMTTTWTVGQKFEFNKIVCTTGKPALVLNGRNGYIDGIYLESIGDCIKLGNTDIAYDCYIHISWAKSLQGSNIIMGGGGNVSECTIIGERFTYYIVGVYFDLSVGFVGQNRIIGVVFECISDAEQVDGWAFMANGTNFPMTGLTLVDVSLEAAHGGFNFANSRVDLPITPLHCFGLRTSELSDVNKYKLLRLTGNGIFAGNIFGDIINLDSIDVSLHNPDILLEQSFSIHGRLKWKGRGWKNARIIGNKVVPEFTESVASPVSSPTYNDENLPYTTNPISGNASWEITFPFEGEILFIATADNTQLTVNDSVIPMSNAQTVKIRTTLWQNPTAINDIRINIIITKPNGTVEIKTVT